MDKLDNFLKTLENYKIITKKICNRDNLSSNIVSVLNQDFTYSTILKKISLLETKLKKLKDKNIISYSLLAADFESNVYYNNQNNNNIENFFFKKQYNELINNSNSVNNVNNSIPFPKHSTIPWENIFTQENNNYIQLLENEFPFSDVKNTTGQIYKKFQSLLHLIFWFEEKLNLIYSKNEEFLNNMNEVLLCNKEVNEKLGSINSISLDNFITFLKDNENINETVNEVNEIKKNGKKFIDDISLKTTEALNLLNDLKTSKEQTNELLKINKVLSTKLSSKALSGTFEKAASSYNWSKRGKLFLIFLLSFGLFYFAYDMLKNFDIDKMILLEKSPLVLLIYSTPRLFIFIISAWVLKFLISNYNNDSKVALDFKHRQAIADVTPHFKKELDSNEKQEDLVVNAFNVFLSKPQLEINKAEKEKVLFFENIPTILNDSEIKNTFLKLRELVINKIKTKKTEEKD